MPSSRFGRVCYVVFGTIGLAGVVVALNAAIVAAAIATGLQP